METRSRQREGRRLRAIMFGANFSLEGGVFCIAGDLLSQYGRSPTAGFSAGISCTVFSTMETVEAVGKIFVLFCEAPLSECKRVLLLR